MNSGRRAAAFAAALAALSACAKAPRTSEQRAPSGRVYAVVGAGTVSLGAGGRALGLEYLAGSLDDADRLELDAEELMTLLSGDADRGGFSAIVVTAFKPSRLALFKKGRSRTTVFTRGSDGVWRSRAPQPASDAASRAADLRAIDDAYARIERAVAAKDAADLEAMQAPGFWHRLADGTVRPREQENAALEKSLASVSDITARMTVSSVTVSGATAVVVAAMESRGALKSSGRRFRSTTVSRDTWSRSPRGWKLSLSADLDDRFEPSGRK